MKEKNPAAGTRQRAGATLPEASAKVAVAKPLDAAMLFASGPEVVIVHGDDVYRLRLTRQNKLILTK